jgi:YspA, cpYpsA-related SLOG family
MIVLVCGGRSFTRYETVERYLDMLNALHGFTRVIHGAEPKGADRCADQWAGFNRIDCRKFPAEWSVYRKGAGPLRNARMINEGQPDLVVAFPGGKGTGNMKMQAEQAGIKIIDLADERVRLQIEADYRALKAA